MKQILVSFLLIISIFPVASTAIGADAPDPVVPPITAEKFPVKIQKHSDSNRVYVMNYTRPLPPKTGEVLLLKLLQEPIMALRVLRNNATLQTITTQVIKTYGARTELLPDETYDAILKSGDILVYRDLIVAPEAEFEDPSWSLTEDRLLVLANDPELDIETLPSVLQNETARRSPAGSMGVELMAMESKLASLEAKVENLTYRADSSAPPANALTPVKPETAKDKSEIEALEAEAHQLEGELEQLEETKVFDKFTHWLTAGFGYVTNKNATSTGLYNFSAFNFRYGVTIVRRLILKSNKPQDSLALEGAVFLYKGLNFAAQGDSYTFLSAQGVLRYNVFFSEGFGVFGTAGLLQGNVLSPIPTGSKVAGLNSILPAFGAGLLLEVGPSWWVRLDVGYDNTSFNISLRF